MQPAGDPRRPGRSRRPTPGCPSDDRTEWAAFREEYDRTHRADCGRTSTPGAASRARRRCRTSSSCTRRRDLNLYVYPRGRRLHRSPAARPRRGTGSTRRSGRPTRAFELPAELADRPAGAALIYLSLGSLGSADVDADAAARRGPGRHAASLHRLEGPAARRLRPRAEHVGRRVPAADDDRPARRPRDHPRRQQHDDRGLPLRQADDRAAAVLGPVRQRPAGRRDRLRRPARRRTPSRTTSCAARSTGCSATRTCAAGWPGSGRRSGHGTGSRRPRTRSRRSGWRAGDGSPIAPRRDARRPGDPLRDRVPRGRLAARARRGRRRRAVRREVPRRRPGPARPRRGVARRRDRPRARPARARPRRGRPRGRIADSEPRPGDPRPARGERRPEHRARLPARLDDVQPGRRRDAGSRLGGGRRLARRARDEPRPLAEEPEPARLARPDRG